LVWYSSLRVALQVENLLDNIIDPAEHQIAVECLVVISRIEERNPELTLVDGLIDLKRLILEAVKSFWELWISKQANQGIVKPSRLPIFQKVVDTVAYTPIINGPPSAEIDGSNQKLLGELGIKNATRMLDEKTIQKPGASSLHQNLDLGVSTSGGDSINGSDLSFEKNDRLARRLFFDLRQDGANGTMSYLASACVRLAFGVSWSNQETSAVATSID
jgi:hypothetical protein